MKPEINSMKKKKENPIRKVEPYRILNDLLGLNKDIDCDKIIYIDFSKKSKEETGYIYIHKK